MATTEILEQQPALREAGEPCEDCGFPLAGDQRYCLNCGARLAFPDIPAPMLSLAPPCNGRHSREGGNPRTWPCQFGLVSWIRACAGMTL